MNWLKLGKALLFPHIAIMLVLLPLATVLLVYSMVFLGTTSPVAIASYVIAFYTLTVWCLRLPDVIRSVKNFKDENKYARLWLEDTHLRVKVSLYGSLVINTAYALMQLGLGFYHSSFWFYSLAAYYFVLAMMRFFLVRYTGKNKPGERMRDELVRYRACGIIFFIMNLALTLMIFFMVYFDRAARHHEITTIAMAAYTFTSLTMAIVNIVKYKKYNSPVYSAAKAVSLASASVSMLTLEATMLTTFDKGELTVFGRRLLLGLSGGAVSVFVLTLAVVMIVNSTKKIKCLKHGDNNGNKQ